MPDTDIFGRERQGSGDDPYDAGFYKPAELVDQGAASPLSSDDALTYFLSKIPGVGPLAATAAWALPDPDNPKKRFQWWPEKMLRSGLTLPSDVMSGKVPVFDDTGHVSDETIERTQDLAGLMPGGMIAAPNRVPILPNTRGNMMERLGVLRAQEQQGRSRTMEVPRIQTPAARESGVLLSDSEAGTGVAAVGQSTKAPVFYSTVERAVDGAKMTKGTAEQWQGYLKNQPGVKSEELGYLGLDDLPKGQQLTKSDVLKHVQDNNVKIDEVWKKGEELDEGMIGDRAAEIMERDHPDLTPEHAEYYGHYDEATAQADSELRAEGTAPKYADYQLPGGDNYRELLMTMPRKAATKADIEAGRARTDQDGNLVVGDVFKHSHWDEPNVLVHVRMNDLELPDVGKSLHLEEVQSDWHQAGRKEGYKQPISESERPQAIAKLHDLEQQLNAMYSKRDTGEYQALKVEADMLRNRITGNSGVPDAPFKTTWADLAVKRALREAADNGYDAVSWTPGEQQANRYSLSKQIERLHYNKTDKGYLLAPERSNGQEVPVNNGLPIPENKLADYVGKEIADKIIRGEGSGMPDKSKWRAERNKGDNDWSVYDEHNKLLNSYRVEAANADRAIRTVYEDRASKVKAPGITTLENVDLKVGGEGMKAFYDKMLVDKFNSYAKKHGGKVEWRPTGQYDIVPYKHQDAGGFEILDVNDNHMGFFKTKDEAQAWVDKNDRVPVLRLNDKMRQAYKSQGFPLFAGGLPLVPVDHDPFDDKTYRSARPSYLPVDHDPFSFTPVDHDPFKRGR